MHVLVNVSLIDLTCRCADVPVANLDSMGFLKILLF